MSTHRNIDKICVVVLVLVLLLTIAFMNGQKLGIKVVTDQDAESYNSSAYFTTNDMDGDWAENSYTTYITLDGSEGKIKGNGAYFLNGDLVISNGGWYVISGTLEDGKIVVDAHNSSKVWIRLNGVTVNCSDDACLRIDQADKVFLTLAEGSENSFTSGSEYSEDALSDKTGGVIFSHDDLTINGSGSLTLTAGYKHGIDVNDSLVITGGNISITAPQDGIHVNDSFRFTNAALTMEVDNDGVHSDDELYIESGTILVASCYEGLEAKTVDIDGGDITIYSSDDGINANDGSDMMGPGNMGGGPPPDHMAPPDHAEGSADGQTDASISSDDTNRTSLSSNSSESEKPSMPVEISESNKTMQTEDGSSLDEEETYIRIRGGTLTIINKTGRDADGLDSNGNIYIDGGDIRISLPGEGSNSAIDYGSEQGGECIVTGGTVLAFGGSGMAEKFSSSSTQCSVLYNLDSTVQAGTLFCVLNANGEEVLSYTPECSYSSVAFSTRDLTVGETYTVVYGETGNELTPDSTSVSVGNSGNRGGMGGGGWDRPTPPDGRMGPPPRQHGDGPDHSGNKTGSSSGSTETDNNGANNKPPDFQNGDGGEGNTFDSKAQSDSEGSETTSSSFVSLGELDNNIRILLGSSVLTLVVAVLFAKKYRRNRY